MATFVLFAAMLTMMLMRVRLPMGVNARGKPLKVIGLSLMERSIYQRVNIYSIGSVVLLTAVTGLLAPAWELLIVLVALGFLLLPVRISATTAGIGINNVVFRPWDEFVGYSTERRRIRLVPRAGLRPLFVPLLAARQEQLIPAIRRYLKPVAAPSSAATRRQRPAPSALR